MDFVLSILSKELNILKDIEVLSHHTNMIFIKVKNEDLIKEYLKENGILVGASCNKLRLVCHRDISQEDIDKIIEVFKAL